MKTTTSKRHFTRRAKTQMNNVQALRERLKGLLPITPTERIDELQACLDILEGHIDFVLEGGDPSYNEEMIRQLRLCGMFRESVEMEASFLVDCP